MRTNATSPSMVSFIKSRKDAWCSIGRLETKESEESTWSDDGQCIVIDDSLIMTAAHVCFYDKNQSAREATKKSMIQQLKLKELSLKLPNDLDLDAEVSIRTLASKHAHQEFPADYVPFSSFRAVFHEPISSPTIDKPLSDRKQWDFICELIRYSDSMDVAVLRVVSPSSSTSIKLRPFETILSYSSLDVCLPVCLVAYRPGLPRPIQSQGNVEGVNWEKKKTGSQGQFQIGLADYNKQDGYSGSAVLHWDASKNDFVLVGIHTGTEFKEYEEATVDDTVANETSASSSRSRSLSASTFSDHSDSYIPSADNTPDFSHWKTGLANRHAQTNSSWATFVGIDSILQREHWKLEYLRTFRQRSGSIPKKNPRKRRLLQTKRNDQPLLDISTLLYNP